ncbi:uncharacterized protein [Dermacentor andersoni]|uniref:uncharacterized protein n=1 Tax=Dermacentor andersoni TaxID=34620 RepID=UPI0024168531|nr:uncharacterized protein LOC129387457 [Dermacentor andersoni]
MHRARNDSKPSITFVYRVSGISRTFTHPYFDNFYTEKLNERNLSSIIDEDLARPVSAYAGSKSVAISMTLMARMCPRDTMVNFNTYSNCNSTPLDVSRLCRVPPGYIQCLHYSVMTRHYNGNNNVTQDFFFEVESTFKAKVRLILQQLERARASPVAFIIERYEMEAQGVITFYDSNSRTDVQCGAKPFGYTAATKAELEKF